MTKDIFKNFFRVHKYKKIGPYELSAVLLITVAALIRVILIANAWPLTNSDEAINTGLPALHILTRGELPIFAYGINYQGTLEAYLAAVFFLLFGPSIFAIRLGLVILYAAFLILLYLLTRLLYSKGIALATLFWLCWGSTDTLFGQLSATGRIETWPFATLLLLLTSWLALSFQPDISSQERRKRLIAYGCIGCVIGLGLWSDMLILPFVFSSLLLLLFFCHRELFTQSIFCGILGFLIGSFPLLVFNIHHFSDNSVVTLWQYYTIGGTPLNLRLAILGATLITIPTATGANPLCPISGDPGQWVHHLSLPCMTFQTCWGWGVIIVWTLAVFAVTKELREQRQAFLTSGSAVNREHLIRCASRLMLLISAGLITLAYMTSPNAVLYPVTSGRYLMGLLVATPSIVAFLWPSLPLSKVRLTPLVTEWTPEKIANSIKIGLLCLMGTAFIFAIISPLDSMFSQFFKAILPRTSGYDLLGFLVAISIIVACLLRGTGMQPALSRLIVKVYSYMLKFGLFCFISLILIQGTITTFQSIPDVQKGMQRQNILTNNLLRLHTPHIYSDYWTCNRLIFLSDEHIICSVLNADLSPGWNRYQLYEQIVKDDPHPSYVFDTENGGVGTFQSYSFAQLSGTQYHRIELAGFVIYLPASKHSK